MADTFCSGPAPRCGTTSIQALCDPSSTRQITSQSPLPHDAPSIQPISYHQLHNFSPHGQSWLLNHASFLLATPQDQSLSTNTSISQPTSSHFHATEDYSLCKGQTLIPCLCWCSMKPLDNQRLLQNKGQCRSNIWTPLGKLHFLIPTSSSSYPSSFLLSPPLPPHWNNYQLLPNGIKTIHFG